MKSKSIVLGYLVLGIFLIIILIMGLLYPSISIFVLGAIVLLLRINDIRINEIEDVEIQNSSYEPLQEAININNTITMTNQKHGFPALLSFFLPGVGQLVKGHILKAILIWIIGTIVTVFLWWTFIVPFIIWAWNVYDAYNSN